MNSREFTLAIFESLDLDGMERTSPQEITVTLDTGEVFTLEIHQEIPDNQGDMD